MDVLRAVGDGIALGSRDRAAARALFDELWRHVGDGGDPLHRCAIAHSMADVQDDPADELAWDLRALAAARSLTDARVSEAGILGPASAFLPSLHLNLADVYRRLGETLNAREHVVAGRAALAAMDVDEYRSMLEAAFDRVETGLEDRSAGYR